jgi:mono/diheme cytochrome c family protein
MLKMHTSKFLPIALSLFLLAIIYTGCKHDPDSSGEPTPPDPPDPKECDTLNVTFYGSVLPIFQQNCISCHSGANPDFGIDLTNFDHLASIIDNGSLVGAVNHAAGFYPMPKGGNKLSDCDIRKIEIWAADTNLTVADCDTTNVTYPGTVLPILKAKCFECHSGPTPDGNLDFNNYAQVAFIAESGALMGALNHDAGYVPMPKDGNKLDDCSIAQIGIWVRDTTFTDPGGGNEHPCDPDTVYFQNEILPLIISSCATTNCHDKLTDDQDVLLVDYASIIKYGEVEPGDPWDSELYEKIMDSDPDDRMPPPPADPLNTEQKNKIKKWIEQGALNNSCDEACDTTNVTYSGTIWPIIELNCFGCHSGAEPSGGILLTDYASITNAANSGKLYGAINHDAGYQPMPKNAPKLSDCKIDQVKIWIEDGTPNN